MVEKTHAKKEDICGKLTIWLNILKVEAFVNKNWLESG